VTTKELLAQLGFEGLAIFPTSRLENAGPLGRDKPLAGAFPGGFAAADLGAECDDRPGPTETAVEGTDP
jgi:hypothetical protein